MKKLNKLFASATASLLCFSTITALSVNAIASLGWKNDETTIRNLIRDGYDVEDTEALLVWDNSD